MYLENQKGTFWPKILRDKFFTEISKIRKNVFLRLVEIRLHPIIKIKPLFSSSQFTELKDINFYISSVLH